MDDVFDDENTRTADGRRKVMKFIEGTILPLLESGCGFLGIGTRKHIDGWTPRTCYSIAHYETGLLKGILPDAVHHYKKSRSLDNEICELIISNNQ
ncbi:MAG: hypothetical protein ACLQG5_04490 [Methanobacterium sp.]|jgi:hypothetical protein